MKKLCICIPTYNRTTLLISQLEFLKEELEIFNEFVEIIVAENFSSQANRDMLTNYHSVNNFFDLKLNSVNLGSTKNVYYLLDCVDSEYVWFVSDDDVLLKGVLARVLDILSNHKDLLHIYLNYSAFSISPDIIDYTPDMLQYSGYYPEGKQCVVDLFKKNGTISMFITSCIYATEPLKNYCSLRNKQTLIDPLLFSFKLAVGATYIEPEVFVLERCVGFSWVSESLAIFSWQVQLGLIELMEHSYNKSEIKEMIFSLYRSNKANYLRMLLQSPFQDKVKIISFLGHLQLKLILPSLIFNTKRAFVKSGELFH